MPSVSLPKRRSRGLYLSVASRKISQENSSSSWWFCELSSYTSRSSSDCSEKERIFGVLGTGSEQFSMFESVVLACLNLPLVPWLSDSDCYLRLIRSSILGKEVWSLATLLFGLKTSLSSTVPTYAVSNCLSPNLGSFSLFNNSCLPYSVSSSVATLSTVGIWNDCKAWSNLKRFPEL